MAWLMFKDSGNYQYRGKKCDGFPSFSLPLPRPNKIENRPKLGDGRTRQY